MDFSDTSVIQLLCIHPFVFYRPEDGHMIGRNMYEFIMYRTTRIFNVLVRILLALLVSIIY